MKNPPRTALSSSRTGLNSPRAGLYPLSPIGSIDGGEGRGEGAALLHAEARRKYITPAPHATLSPKQVRGEGLRPRAAIGAASVYPLSPISFIDRGVGWGEGPLLPFAEVRTQCLALRIPR